MTRLFRPIRFKNPSTIEPPVIKPFAIEPPGLLEASQLLFAHARSMSVSGGLWFCTPLNDTGRYQGWAIPPFAQDESFTIRANGIDCSLDFPDEIPIEMNCLFDRFGLKERVRKYVFEFDAPTKLNDQEVVITCHFNGGPCSVFSSYYQTGRSQVETPAFNMHRVTRSTDFAYFSFMGYTQCCHIKALMQNYQISNPTILDWGCGAARVLRHFQGDQVNRLLAVDVDTFNVEWCRETFGRMAEFSVIDPMGGCPFDDGSIDVVYGISVFTHLNQESEKFWLRELYRLLRPGGLAVMSVHGELTFFKTINDFWIYEQFISRGYFDAGSCPDLKVDGKDTISENLYRNVFHTRPYIEKHWGEYFNVVDYIPGGSTAHQDYVVLIRR